MTKSAIEVLNRVLTEQDEKLIAVQEANAEDIRRGERARQEVAEQQRHVDEVAAAIDVLINHERAQQVDA